MAWLIVAEPRAHWRQWWVDKMGVRVVVLETPLPVCVERVTCDDRRSTVEVRQRHCEGIGWWWANYERRDDDLIIRPDARATTGRALQRAQGSS